MRVLFQTTALLALSSTACMSSNSRNNQAESRPAGLESDKSPGSVIIDEAPAEESMTSNTSSEAPQLTQTTKAEGDCEEVDTRMEFPVFVRESHALVIGFDQSCKKNKEGGSSTYSSLSAIGVPCTGGPGLVDRRGHSNTNWEFISFAMDLSCPMKQQDVLKNWGTQTLGIKPAQMHSVQVPLMIEFWEFVDNRDAGIGTKPTLTAAGGGASQWNARSKKFDHFSVKLYGHTSSISKDSSLYEATALIQPRGNQRQFDVLVQEMKKLSPEDTSTAKDRCLAKTGQKSECQSIFSEPQ